MTKDADSLLGSTLPRAPSVDGLRGEAQGGRISLLIYHSASTQVVTLVEGQKLTVGRDPAVEVTIVDQSLSRRHASFEVVAGEVWVEDLGSTNGTLLNQQPIKRARMSVADEVAMGSVTASIHLLPPAEIKRFGIESHDHFVLAVEHEVERCKSFGRHAALLMLKPALPAAGSLARHAPSIRRHLRPLDWLALYSESTIEILVPEATLEHAIRLAETLVVAAEGRPLLLGGISVFPESGTCAEALLDGCRDALRRAAAESPVQVARSEARSWHVERPLESTGLVVRNPVMREIYDTVQRVATSTIPVLLAGETGTGKEVLARLIHDSGPRRDRRMACINCGAIPPTLMESALFGHEKGAFTGATQSSKGLFEEADGGTVLLDEVGELSPPAQAALLRVLETKRLTRVGSSKEIAVDVRIVAATNRDLEAMCQQEKFRWDLLYRLNAMTLEIPPLRERPDEIAALCELFVAQANAANGCSVAGIEAEAMRLLHRYAWPGNVRELRNAVERAVVIARADRIAVQDLPQRVRQAAGEPAAAVAPQPALSPVTVPIRPDPAPACTEPPAPLPEGTEGTDLKAQLQQYEAGLILEALRRADWNRAEAAKQLGIPVRTLSHKMGQYGIKKLGYGLEDE